MNLSQYIKESLLITESFRGNKFYVYTTSKDSNFEQYFFAEELKFANNAGNEYGCGVYALCQEPKDAGIGYSDQYRESLYGTNQYEIEILAQDIFYINYKYFCESPLFAKLKKPTETEYIKAQLEFFKIKIPTQEILDSLYPIESRGKLNEGPAAFNFYKYMNSLYYQRKDGSLNSPVVGFVYKGRNDGETCVIWSPYETKIVRKNIENQGWKSVEELTKKEAKKEISEIDHIFDGNKTEEKEQIYRLLVAYKGKSQVLGQFTQIRIHDNKTIDAVYKSNLPNIDNYHHCYQLSENDYIEKITSLGYRFNYLESWLKFGQSSQLGKDTKGYTPLDCPEEFLPKEISGGFFLSNCDITKETIKKLQQIKHEEDAIVIRSSYIQVDTIPFNDIKFINAYVDDYKYEEFVAKYNTQEGEIIRRSEFEAKKKKK